MPTPSTLFFKFEFPELGNEANFKKGALSPESFFAFIDKTGKETIFLQNKGVYSPSKDNYFVSISVRKKYLHALSICACDDEEAFYTKINTTQVKDGKTYTANVTVCSKHEVNPPYKEGDQLKVNIIFYNKINSLSKAKKFLKSLK